MNLYIYVGNNPLNWIDPWGLCKELSDPDFSFFKPQTVFKLASDMELRLFPPDKIPGGRLPYNNNFRHAYAAGLLAQKYTRPVASILVDLHAWYADDPPNWDTFMDRAAEQRGLEVGSRKSDKSLAERLLQYYPNDPRSLGMDYYINYGDIKYLYDFSYLQGVPDNEN